MIREPFNCTKCGACCRLVPDAILEAVGLPKHPTQSGCGNLKDDLTCAIYETRPLVCSVDGMFEHYYEPLGWTWDEFCIINEKICRDLEKELTEKDNAGKVEESQSTQKEL